MTCPRCGKFNVYGYFDKQYQAVLYRCPSCGYVEFPQPTPGSEVYGQHKFNIFSLNDTNVPIRSKKSVLILCIFLGMFGVHRFYTGKFITGLIYFCTLGLFGTGYLHDIVQILDDEYVDINGNFLS